MRITRRIAMLAILSGSFCLAQDKDFSKVEIKVTKVAGTVYMLQGAGGNIGASVGDDGIVVVDDQYAPLADKIQAALKGITDRPVRFVINTHYQKITPAGTSSFRNKRRSSRTIMSVSVLRKAARRAMAGPFTSSTNRPPPECFRSSPLTTT